MYPGAVCDQHAAGISETFLHDADDQTCKQAAARLFFFFLMLPLCLCEFRMKFLFLHIKPFQLLCGTSLVSPSSSDSPRFLIAGD